VCLDEAGGLFFLVGIDHHAVRLVQQRFEIVVDVHLKIVWILIETRRHIIRVEAT
jgi:hypothetical protein